jgi:mannose-6-phosphate isomerase-like protein (cupin superfamily)
MQKIIWTVTLLVVIALPGQSSAQHNPPGASQAGVTAPQAMSARYGDLQWQSMVPELGADSPQISILRVDDKTHATHLLIRMPKQMHVPMHWHSANETHTVIKGTMVFEHDGQRHELGPGGFNYLPARTHHQAWSSDDALVFITVDSGWDVNWVSGPPTASNLGGRPPSR